MHACPRRPPFPARLYLLCLLSEAVVHGLWVDTFPLGSDAAEHVRSSIQYLANARFHHFNICLLTLYNVYLHLSHWPAKGADPWRDEPTLSTRAESNLQPVSSHLQNRADHSWWRSEVTGRRGEKQIYIIIVTWKRYKGVSHADREGLASFCTACCHWRHHGTSLLSVTKQKRTNCLIPSHT